MTSLDTSVLLNAIRRRRSVPLKQLAPDPIDHSHITMMLEAANWAPSHGQTEPWRFTVFSGEGRRVLYDAFGEAYRLLNPGESYTQAGEDAQRQRAWLAPVWISLGMAPGLLPDGRRVMPEWEEIVAFGSAVQNMHLVASNLGLASKWTSNAVATHDHVARVVGLEPPARLFGFLYVGKLVGPWPEGKRQPITNKVRWVHD